MLEFLKLARVLPATNKRSEKKDSLREQRGTALLRAARQGDYTQLVALLRCGADPNVTTCGDMALRPLHLAAAGGHVGVVQALVQSGAKLETSDKDGLRPLHHAAHCGNVNVIRALLAAGARVGSTTAAGDTPAHLAARCGMVAAAVMLVQAGAPLQTRNKAWSTALDVAAPEVRRAMLCALPGPPGRLAAGTACTSVSQASF